MTVVLHDSCPYSTYDRSVYLRNKAFIIGTVTEVFDIDLQCIILKN